MKESANEAVQRHIEMRRPIHEKEERLESLSGSEAEALANEIFRDQVKYNLDLTLEWLSEQWGIDNLSTMEGLALRKIIEDGLRQRAKELKMVAGGEIQGSEWIMQHRTEYIARWLNELYNIRDIKIELPISESIKEYISRLRKRAHNP